VFEEHIGNMLRQVPVEFELINPETIITVQGTVKNMFDDEKKVTLFLHNNDMERLRVMLWKNNCSTDDIGECLENSGQTRQNNLNFLSNYSFCAGVGKQVTISDLKVLPQLGDASNVLHTLASTITTDIEV
jgi:hypothetical protein